MLSNGPGDPAENTDVIKEIKQICEWNKEQMKSQPEKAQSRAHGKDFLREKQDENKKTAG